MSKQKWLIAGLSLVMAASIGVGISACGKKEPDTPPEHTHEFTKWQHNDTQHWMICPADDAIWEQGKVDHTFKDGECECGAKEGEKHTHEFTEWRHDETQHWMVCPTDGEIWEQGKVAHDFKDGKCECGATEGSGPVTPAELDPRDFYVVGKGAGDLKNGTWNGADEKFKFTKAEKTDAEGYTVYTFKMKLYSDDEFKFIEKNAITQGTDDDGNPTTVWHDELVFTADDLDETAAKGVFKNVNGNIVVETGADGVYEFTIRTKKDGELKENKVTFTLKEKVDPLGIQAQYDMYIVGTVGAKIGCNWPSNYPAATMVADVAKYCYHLELQKDNETFSVLANLRTSDKFKVWNAKLADKDAGYYPTGLNNDLTVKTNGWYVVSWKAGSSTVSVTMHEHEYTEYAHGVRGTTQHWKVCSICGAKQEGSEEDHSYGESGTENCVCGVEPGWGDHVHDYTVWKRDNYGYQHWKACEDDDAIWEQGKVNHTFNAQGECECGFKLTDVHVYLSLVSRDAANAQSYLDAIRLGQTTEESAAENNPMFTCDPATKTFSLTIAVGEDEIWTVVRANAVSGKYFDTFYAPNGNSVVAMSRLEGKAAGVYNVSFVYGEKTLTITPATGHEHSYDDDTTDEICNTCGFVRHFFAKDWVYDDAEHWHAATCGHADKRGDVGEHQYDEGSDTCKVCGAKKVTPAAKFTYELNETGDGYLISGVESVSEDVTELVLPDTYGSVPVVGIKHGVFSGTSSMSAKSPVEKFAKITKVTLGANMTYIGNYTFRGWTALKDVVFNDKALQIGDQLFRNTAIETIVVPEFTYIQYSYGDYMFGGCASLTTVTLPDCMQKIPSYCFQNCTALTSVTFGNNVTEFQQNAFDGCSQLEELTLPATLTKLGNYSLNKTGLKSLTIPNGVTEIPTSLCAQCTALTSVDFGTGVTKINATAFQKTGLVSVTIPAQVTYVSIRAFTESASLTSVTFANPDGWTKYTKETDATGTAQSFADAAANAELFKATYKFSEKSVFKRSEPSA